MQETPVPSLGREYLLEKDRLPTSVFMGFPCGSAGKEPICNVGDLDSIPRLGRSLGEGKGYLLQCSVLENSMDCIVHGATKSRTWLSDFHSLLDIWFVNIFSLSVGWLFTLLNVYLAVKVFHLM